LGWIHFLFFFDVTSMADTVENLEKRIAEFTEHKKKLDAALKLDPNNKQFRKLRDDAAKLISTTEEVLLLKKQEEAKKKKEASPQPQPPQPKQESIQPPPPKHQMEYKVGHVCRAKWSQDQQWYDAVIKSVDPMNGTYTVLFTGYGNTDIVRPEHISPITSSLKSEQDLTPIAIPESLKINKEDALDVKVAKKKKIHSIKSKNRFIQMDAMTNSKKNEWKNFMDKVGRGKRGVPLKKESMFKSPDTVDGKVGVVGSGKGMTTFADTRKVDTRRNKVELSLEQPK